MSYPATAQVTSPVPVDSVGLVLSQALDRLAQVEQHLGALVERIKPANQLGKADVRETPPMGVLQYTIEVRNSATRLDDLCARLDALL